MNHGELCACTVCVLARAYDSHTAESDAAAQVTMARLHSESALALARRSGAAYAVLKRVATPNQ